MASIKKILCYGDSLTAGYCFQGMKFVPYSETLLTKLFVLGTKVEVDHYGFSGWTTEQMLDNIDKERLQDFTGKKGPGLKQALKVKKYDLLILMAGTNDLGYSTCDEIASNLHKLTQCGVKSDVSVLNIGIPDSGFIYMNGTIREKGDTINKKLESYSTNDQSGTVTYADAPIEYLLQCEHFDSDGLHFSVSGYKSFGEELAKIVHKIFSKP